MRIRNGRRKPFNIKVWCLGNEMDGDWQIGHKSAREYGRLAAETSKLLKLIDPTAETVVCGSSSREMATYKEWEREVLDLCYDTVDYLSLHQYYEPLSVSGDVRSYLSLAERMNSFICEVTQICDEVGKKKHSDKKNRTFVRRMECVVPPCRTRKTEEKAWQIAPPQLENVYNFHDAVIFTTIEFELKYFIRLRAERGELFF